MLLDEQYSLLKKNFICTCEKGYSVKEDTTHTKINSIERMVTKEYIYIYIYIYTYIHIYNNFF